MQTISNRGEKLKSRSMKPPSESKNIVAVRCLYEAHLNPDIVKTVLAPEVRWEVVEGFPHSGVYQDVSGVFDFFARLFGDFEDWRTEPAEIFEAGDRVIGLGFYSARAKATGRTFKARFADVWTMRDGVIVRLQQCADTVQLAKASGQDLGK
jgi:ketosteroid isomerase-like protein